jgi:hypothetical protein
MQKRADVEMPMAPVSAQKACSNWAEANSREHHTCRFTLIRSAHGPAAPLAPMITADELQAFDLLIWLGTGQLAASRCGCSQPTISRQTRQVTSTLAINLRRRQGEWEIHGDTLLLALERQLHQLFRLNGRAPLRLEASCVAGPLLANPLPEGWIGGRFDHLVPATPLRFLRERVIDAWITSSLIDLPADIHVDCQVVPLTSAPTWLVASPDHPLAGVGNLRRSDLEAFPSLALDGNSYAVTAQRLQAQGLWREPLRLERFDHEQLEGRSSDGRTLGYATPQRLSLSSTPLQRLDWDLGLERGEALVMRRDVAEHSCMAALREELRRRAGLLCQRLPELTAQMN